MMVRSALASGLQPRSSEKKYDFGNSCAEDNSAKLKMRERGKMGTVRVTPLQECFGD